MKKSSLNQTPRSSRLHIAIFGKMNAGKSSLINAITGQNTALVSKTAGTTTDPVYKSMELHPIGPCVLIDTAGFDDASELGKMRVEKTRKVLDTADICVVVFTDEGTDEEAKWIDKIKKRGLAVLAVLNKSDALENVDEIKKRIAARFDVPVVVASATERRGIDEIKDLLVKMAPKDFELPSITGHLVKKEDVVLLVMPQDIQAPKGRLILPQVQTIRDLLENECIVVSATTKTLKSALGALAYPPKLIITDSQVFSQVASVKPKESMLTSFSVLFARYKGDIQALLQGAAAIDTLRPTDRVLIAEACTHAPQKEDIGRVKLPRMLRKKVGEELKVDVVGGSDFPSDLTSYALIIHCGACMFNRRYVLSRVNEAKRQGVPITNYGIALAKLSGILDRIEAV